MLCFCRAAPRPAIRCDNDAGFDASVAHEALRAPEHKTASRRTQRHVQPCHALPCTRVRSVITMSGNGDGYNSGKGKGGRGRGYGSGGKGKGTAHWRDIMNKRTSVEYT